MQLVVFAKDTLSSIRILCRFVPPFYRTWFLFFFFNNYFFSKISWICCAIWQLDVWMHFKNPQSTDSSSTFPSASVTSQVTVCPWLHVLQNPEMIYSLISSISFTSYIIVYSSKPLVSCYLKHSQETVYIFLTYLASMNRTFHWNLRFPWHFFQAMLSYNRNQRSERFR